MSVTIVLLTSCPYLALHVKSGRLLNACMMTSSELHLSTGFEVILGPQRVLITRIIIKTESVHVSDNRSFDKLSVLGVAC